MNIKNGALTDNKVSAGSNGFSARVTICRFAMDSKMRTIATGMKKTTQIIFLSIVKFQRPTLTLLLGNKRLLKFCKHNQVQNRQNFVEHR
jgi:hypothetical protein